MDYCYFGLIVVCEKSRTELNDVLENPMLLHLDVQNGLLKSQILPYLSTIFSGRTTHGARARTQKCRKHYNSEKWAVHAVKTLLSSVHFTVAFRDEIANFRVTTKCKGVSGGDGTLIPPTSNLLSLWATEELDSSKIRKHSEPYGKNIQ